MSRAITATEALSSGHHVDYVATIPYSSNIEVVNNRLTPVLSLMSRMALDASAVVWEHHPKSQLVMIGETCYPGLPTTSDLMEERAVRIFGGESQSGNIVPLAEYNGETLDNTVYHVTGLAEYLMDQPPGATVAVGLKYHRDRVLTHVEGNDLELEYVAAEDVLAAADMLGPYEPYLPYLAKLERSERLLRTLSKLNPHGDLFKKAIRISGPRVVDLKMTESGEVVFINSTAKKRLAEEKKKLQPTA